MLLKAPFLAAAAAVLLVGGAYAASPFVTLYRLHEAIRTGDAATVRQLVDWDSVRDGLDEEVAGMAVDMPDTQAVSTGARLAPFGFSFLRGVASRVVAAEVTPPKLLQALHGGGEGSRFSLRFAYFNSPTEFLARFAAPHRREVQLRLNLEDGGWRVTRVWVPAGMIREMTGHPEIQAAAD